MASTELLNEPRKTADELRAEFRTAQRRRLVEHGVQLVRDTELPDQGAVRANAPPPDKVD